MLNIRFLNCSKVKRDSLVYSLNQIRLKSEATDEVKSDLVESSIPASFADVEEESPKPPNFFNKSRLLPQHRRMLREEQPYDEPQSWIHLTEKYQRKMFGRYGSKSNVDPRICFPVKEDIADQQEYESVAFPYTLQQMMQKVKEENETRKKNTERREEEIAAKIAKLDQWKMELNAKIAKKEAEALAAKQRKDRLIDEVRRHFGYQIDPKDEKFKELLEQKDREDRKKQKESKRKEKEQKMMAKLIQKAGVGNESEATKKSADEKTDETSKEK